MLVLSKWVAPHTIGAVDAIISGASCMGHLFSDDIGNFHLLGLPPVDMLEEVPWSDTKSSQYNRAAPFPRQS